MGHQSFLNCHPGAIANCGFRHTAGSRTPRLASFDQQRTRSWCPLLVGKVNSGFWRPPPFSSHTSGVKSSIAAALSRNWRDWRDPSEMALGRPECPNIDQPEIDDTDVNWTFINHCLASQRGLTLKTTRGFLPLAHHPMFPDNATQLRPRGSWLRTVLRRPCCRMLRMPSDCVCPAVMSSRTGYSHRFSQSVVHHRRFWDPLLITLSHVSLELCKC